MSGAVPIARSRTAISRSRLSRPVARAITDGLLTPEARFFDYGCGRGDDIRHLTTLGYQASGWDPAYRPNSQCIEADVVNFGYVANVIENPSERLHALQRAWSLTKDVLIVAARLKSEERWIAGRAYEDGLLTSRQTFQKLFTQEELRAWIETALGVRCFAAAPGIYYAFRDEARAQRFLATSVRRRAPLISRSELNEALYQVNRELLAPLETFLLTRGRPPEHHELPELPAIRERFGTVTRASELILKAIGSEAMDKARQSASEDLLVYLALAAFRGRPKHFDLPDEIQLDCKALFGSYRRACSAADALLFSAGSPASIDEACRRSPIGKLTPEALYVHVSALEHLPAILRVYEGCGRVLVGTVEGATIVKLNRTRPRVTYLVYPDFDRSPHPALRASVRADLQQLDLKFSSFQNSTNPPILHRKETMVAPDYPGRDRFARLTAQEERAGLFDEPHAIGTRDRWNELLAQKRLALRGHRLVKIKEETSELLAP